MRDGRVELWDLSRQAVDPLVVHYPTAGGKLTKRSLTTVRYVPPGNPCRVTELHSRMGRRPPWLSADTDPRSTAGKSYRVLSSSVLCECLPGLL